MPGATSKGSQFGRGLCKDFLRKDLSTAIVGKEEERRSLRAGWRVAALVEVVEDAGEDIMLGHSSLLWAAHEVIHRINDDKECKGLVT